MSEERIARIMSGRLYTLMTVTVMALSFDVYWIMVSGWKFMLGAKLIIALLPISITVINQIIYYVKDTTRRNRIRKDIMFKIYIRRIIDKDVA